MVEIFKDGKRVAYSKNLRGILEYARQHGIAKVIIVEHHTESGGTLYIRFGDGAKAKTRFNSYGVLEKWIAARRSWCLQDAGRKSRPSCNMRFFNGPCAN